MALSYDRDEGKAREYDLAHSVATGPDPQVHAAAVNRFVDAGFDQVCVVQVGEDKKGFMRFWADEVVPRL